jgi:hypothetical protein
MLSTCSSKYDCVLLSTSRCYRLALLLIERKAKHTLCLLLLPVRRNALASGGTIRMSSIGVREFFVTTAFVIVIALLG